MAAPRHAEVPVPTAEEILLAETICLGPTDDDGMFVLSSLGVAYLPVPYDLQTWIGIGIGALFGGLAFGLGDSVAKLLVEEAGKEIGHKIFEHGIEPGALSKRVQTSLKSRGAFAAGYSEIVSVATRESWHGARQILVEIARAGTIISKSVSLPSKAPLSAIAEEIAICRAGVDGLWTWEDAMASIQAEDGATSPTSQLPVIEALEETAVALKDRAIAAGLTKGQVVRRAVERHPSFGPDFARYPATASTFSSFTGNSQAGRSLDERCHDGDRWVGFGLALQKERRFDEAITAYRNAAGIFQDLFFEGFGDRRSEGGALTNLGLALQEAGQPRFDESITILEKAAGIFHGLGDRHSESGALNNLGSALQAVGRFDKAIAAYQQDLAICRELGDRHGEGTTLDNLAIALEEVDRFDESIAAHHEAAGIFRDFGDELGEARSLTGLGLALRAVSRFDESIIAHQKAAGIVRALGDKYGEAMVLGNLGLTLKDVGRFDEARRAWRGALKLFVAVGASYQADKVRGNLYKL